MGCVFVATTPDLQFYGPKDKAETHIEWYTGARRQRLGTFTFSPVGSTRGYTTSVNPYPFPQQRSPGDYPGGFSMSTGNRLSLDRPKYFMDGGSVTVTTWPFPCVCRGPSSQIYNRYGKGRSSLPSPHRVCDPVPPFIPTSSLYRPRPLSTHDVFLTPSVLSSTQPQPPLLLYQ